MLPDEAKTTGSVPPMSVVTDARSGAPDVSPDEQDDSVDDENDVDAPATQKRLRPEQKPIFKIAIISVLLLLVVGVVGGGYYAYSILMAPPPPPPITRAPVKPAGPPPPTAEELAAEAAAAAAAEAEVAAAMEAAQKEAKEAIQREKLAAEAPPVAPVIPDPSEAFLAWVNEAKISGVREGAEPRAFINGRLVKQGETIDFTLDIVFDGVDPDRNLVIFKEASGAAVAKKY